MSTKIRCLAVDDEPLALAKLREYISKIPYLELVACCENAFEATRALAEGKIDAMFIDINMPGLSGLDFVSTLDAPPMLVFTTAYAEYAVEGFKVHAVDYLLKPYDFVTFQRAASRLLKRYGCEQTGLSETIKSLSELSQEQHASYNEHHTDGGDTIFVKVDYRYIGIRSCDILYIKGMSEYVQIFVEGRSPLTALLSMREALAKLPPSFVQVHRSYIVNMQHVEEINRQHLRIRGGNTITISDNYRRAFAEYVHTHALERNR